MDSSDWKVRVIDNLYPALRRDEEGLSDAESSGFGRCAVAGFGFHGVVIETPTHLVHLLSFRRWRWCGRIKIGSCSSSGSDPLSIAGCRFWWFVEADASQVIQAAG